MWKNGLTDLDVDRFSPSLSFFLYSVIDSAAAQKCPAIDEINVFSTLLNIAQSGADFMQLEESERLALLGVKTLFCENVTEGIEKNEGGILFSQLIRAGKNGTENLFDRDCWCAPIADALDDLPDKADLNDFFKRLIQQFDRLQNKDIVSTVFNIDAIGELLNAQKANVELFREDGSLSEELFLHRLFLVLKYAGRIAAELQCDQIDLLHILVAMLSYRESYANLLLKESRESNDKTEQYLRELKAGMKPATKYFRLNAEDFSRQTVSVLREASQFMIVSHKQKIGENEILRCLIKTDDSAAAHVFKHILPISTQRWDTLLHTIEEPEEILPDLPTDVCDCECFSSQHYSADNIVIRDEIIEPVLKTMFRKHNSGILLYGESGVGLTTVGKMLSCEIKTGKYPSLMMMPVIHFDFSGLIEESENAGAERFQNRFLRSQNAKYEEAVEKVFAFMEIEPNRIFVLDGIYNYFRTHFDSFCRRIKKLNSRIVLIVSTPEFHSLQNGSKMLSDYLETYEVKEPPFEQCKKMAQLSAAEIETEYSVTFKKEVLEFACVVGRDYWVAKHFPKKAVELLTKTACERSAECEMKESNDRTVKKKDVAECLSGITGIPAETILGLGADKDYFSLLSKSIVGQDLAVQKASDRLDLIQKGMVDKKAPAAIFLFAGLSGTGKTELAKQIAQLYSGSHKLITYPMESFHSEHNISQILGAPPGLVGYEAGGKLINDLNRDPYSVVLLDEIEKAHPTIWDPFLNLFDEGIITDMRGVTANAYNAFFVLTSNIGQYDITRMLRSGCSYEEIADTVEKQFAKARFMGTDMPCFRPEFIGRIMRRGGIVAFNALSLEALQGIARFMFAKIAKPFEETHGTQLECDDEVIEYIAQKVYWENEEAILSEGAYYGGRRIDILLNEYVSNKLARNIRQISGAPLVKVIMNGTQVDIVPVFGDDNVMQVKQIRKNALIDRVDSRLNDLFEISNDTLDTLSEDALQSLDNLLVQIKRLI